MLPASGTSHISGSSNDLAESTSSAKYDQPPTETACLVGLLNQKTQEVDTLNTQLSKFKSHAEALRISLEDKLESNQQLRDNLAKEMADKYDDVIKRLRTELKYTKHQHSVQVEELQKSDKCRSDLVKAAHGSELNARAEEFKTHLEDKTKMLQGSQDLAKSLISALADKEKELKYTKKQVKKLQTEVTLKTQNEEDANEQAQYLLGSKMKLQDLVEDLRGQVHFHQRIAARRSLRHLTPSAGGSTALNVLATSACPSNSTNVSWSSSSSPNPTLASRSARLLQVVSDMNSVISSLEHRPTVLSEKVAAATRLAYSIWADTVIEEEVNNKSDKDGEEEEP